MNATPAFDACHFETMPLIAILRGQQTESIALLIHALGGGGFIAVEITMNTPAAATQIRAAIANAPP